MVKKNLNSGGVKSGKYYYSQGIGLLNEKKKYIKQERWCKHVYLLKNKIWIFYGRSTVNKITWNFIGFGYKFKKGLDNIKQYEFRFNPRELFI